MGNLLHHLGCQQSQTLELSGSPEDAKISKINYGKLEFQMPIVSMSKNKTVLCIFIIIHYYFGVYDTPG
jgi:hypothetical protein